MNECGFANKEVFMTADKIREALSIYQAKFTAEEISKWRFPDDQKAVPFLKATLSHAHWMIDEIYGFLAEGKIEKAHRWLGFIQGVLWATGQYTIEDLAAHSRSL
ncbi:MAG: hypothetical protein A2W41_00415 [Candidatus Ryanbacteria bacterium RIFCSPHIGHO2_01_45_13]|uniref:Uncharacterized protein n=1 Tax=Candidatus Ryanbacteria bacterium RIFCSPHIGHO2_01_45_13 TaxID=1802112 RepID=A0A1G2FYJ4_9BACT|nr:MAG: hypothetical protein A2W41_00415 [Candidatus Ryanbacteria bacterium RIFCSPHIGHO2_01_45_13]